MGKVGDGGEETRALTVPVKMPLTASLDMTTRPPLCAQFNRQSSQPE